MKVPAPRPRGRIARLAIAIAFAGMSFAACDGHSPTSPGTVSNVGTTTSPATITVTPNPDTLPFNQSKQFMAVGKDAGGNVVAIMPSWSVAANGGSISSTGLFTAGAVAGTFSNTVQATSGSLSGYATVVVVPIATSGATDLGTAGTFGILAGSTITCVTRATVNGDMGLWPGSAITGFGQWCVAAGVTHAADGVAQAAQGALTAAYHQLDVMPCGATLTADLGGQTLKPGVYCSLSSQGLTGEMFFDALGDPNATFVIKAASALTTASAKVTLLNGAQAKNIYWLIGSSGTVGVGSEMKGNLIALTSITLADNSTLLGRALARTGAVTLGTNIVITLPGSGGTVGSLATITLSPNPDTVVIGGTQQFTAVGRDAAGNIVAITPTWSHGGAGTGITNTGLFTAGTLDGWWSDGASATSRGITGYARVKVKKGPLASITVTPNPTTVCFNWTRQFTAVGKDAGGNIISGIPTTWSVGATGTISSTGLFTAGTKAGTDAAKATSGTIAGTAGITVADCSLPMPSSDTTLGAAGTYGILAGTTVTCINGGVVHGDVGLWPGSAIVGFPPCQSSPAPHAADAGAKAGQDALTAAFTRLNGLPCTGNLSADLGGQTLKPGVYCSLALGLTGEMFFDAQGDPNAVFVIKAASTLTTAAAKVTLLNGAQAQHIFWVVGSSATVGVGSAMKGSILALTSISIVDNVTLSGRALARNGAVTLGTNDAITVP